MKVAVVGGGSSYTPELVQGLLARRERLAVEELSLMDVDGSRLEVVGGLVGRMIDRARTDLRLVLTESLSQALGGADFVVCQIRVGQMEARRLDETIPLRYGVIGQETTGPGGMFKALRTIPVVLDIAERMERLCPGAWLINFTNPAGLVTEALLLHSRVRAVGLCNLPINLIGEAARHFDLGEDRLRVSWIGLNHLGWVREIGVDGEDRLPEYLDHIARQPGGPWDADLLGALQALPTYYLRYYYYTDRLVSQARAAAGTRAEEVMEVEQGLFALYADPNTVGPPPLLAKRGGARYSEAALNLIESLLQDRGDVQVLNTTNRGAIPDLPPEVCVEAPCRVGAQGPEPIPQAPASPLIRSLLLPVKAYESLTVEAALQGSRQLALQALLAHPLVPSYPIAAALLEDMLAAHRNWLPRFYP